MTFKHNKTNTKPQTANMRRKKWKFLNLNIKEKSTYMHGSKEHRLTVKKIKKLMVLQKGIKV